MRYHYLLAIAFLVFGGSRTAEAQSACPAVTFFGNGIATWRQKAENAAKLLEEAVNEGRRASGEPELNSECFRVAYATKEGGGLVDLLESESQIVLDKYRRFWRGLSQLDVLPSVAQDAMLDAFRGASDLEWVSESDLRDHVHAYRDAITLENSKVILVAHSQGNFFANQAFARLFEGEADPLPRDRFAIVAVATPADYVATHTAHTTLYGDAILAVRAFNPLQLPANTGVAGTPCGPFPLASQLPGLHPVDCHSFEASYLQGLESRPRIIGQILREIETSAPTPNQAPTAAFSMAAQAQVSSDGTLMTVAADPTTHEARVAFNDQSSDPDGAGDIVARVWTVNTQSDPLSVGDRQFTWGFTEGGPYTITLTIRDSSGHVSTAAASLVARSATEVTFDASQDPALAEYFAGVSFSEPKVDPEGNLRVVGYRSGFLFRMHSISRGGELLWSNPSLQSQAESLDQLASRQLDVNGPGQSWFSGSRDRIYSYTSTGDTAPGWPVSLEQPELPPGTGGWTGGLVGVDPSTSIAVARGWASQTFTNSAPGSVYAFRPDGSPAWPRLDFANASEIAMAEGAVYANVRDYAAWFDVSTGNERCRTTGPVPLSYNTVAGPGGVFSSFHEVVARISTDCAVQEVFSSAVSSEVVLLGAGPSIVLAREYLRPGYQLLGISPDGRTAWRQPGIVPAADSLRAVRSGVLYVVGSDPAGPAQKLFLVSEATGAILDTISFDGLCEIDANCGVAVGPAGELYVNDRASTRIFRVR